MLTNNPIDSAVENEHMFKSWKGKDLPKWKTLKKDDWTSPAYAAEWASVEEANSLINKIPLEELADRYPALYAATESAWSGGYPSRSKHGQSPEFKKFASFLAMVGFRPYPSASMDRIDNSLGYEPTNVRWASKKGQSLNRPQVSFEKKLECRLWPIGQRDEWERDYLTYRAEYENRQHFMLARAHEAFTHLAASLNRALPEGERRELKHQAVWCLEVWYQARQYVLSSGLSYYKLLDRNQRQSRDHIQQLVNLLHTERKYTGGYRDESFSKAVLGGIQLTPWGYELVRLLDFYDASRLLHNVVDLDCDPELPRFEPIESIQLEKWKYPEEPRIVIHQYD